MTELDQWEQDKDLRVDQDVSTIAAALNVLLVDSKRLEDAKRDGKKQTMFIADVQVSKALQNYKRKLEDLEKEIEKPTLAFERNEILADLAVGIKELGFLKTQHKGHRHGLKQSEKSRSAKMVIDRKIKSSSEVEIGTDYCYLPCITGCTVMPNGHVVLCDYNNDQVKLLNDPWTITGQLELQDPFDVSVIDSNNVLVSSPDKKQLQKVKVFPKMKTGRTIKLDNKCWGVAVSGKEIYTTCHNELGRGEVKVLDMKGNIKRRLEIKPDGSYLFSSPTYITVSASGEKIFVSDGDKDTDNITCLTPSGTVIYEYKDNDMSWPIGLICDSGDNVLVCGKSSHNVHTISPDDNKYRTLLTSKDGLNTPYSIAYKENEDTLIIGSWNYSKLLLFKLE